MKYKKTTLTKLFESYFKIITVGMATGVSEFENGNDPEEKLMVFFNNLLDPFIEFLSQNYQKEILEKAWPSFDWKMLIKKHNKSQKTNE